LLPPTNPSTGDGNDFTAESIAEHANECVALADRLRKQLGTLDEYWDVFDPTRKEHPIKCSISQDLADIYMDLRDAVKLQESGAETDDICWQWRFDFLSHWSRHAASALKALLIVSSRV
jgi:hypothetical protein